MKPQLNMVCSRMIRIALRLLALGGVLIAAALPATTARAADPCRTTTSIGAPEGQERRPAGGVQAAAQKQRDREYKAILRRAKRIGVRLRSADALIVQQARAQRAQLRIDLQAWARKHNVKLVTREIKHDLRGTAPSTPPDFGSVTIGKRFPKQRKETDAYCEDQLIINEQVCVLDPEKSGLAAEDQINCVYECPEPPKEPEK